MTDFDPEPTCTRPLLAQHDRNAIIKANDMKRVLANIDADHGNRCCRRHGVLLISAAPGQLIASGAGARPDHPFADIGHSAVGSCYPWAA